MRKVSQKKMREQILKSEILNSLMRKSSGSTPPAQIATSPAHSRASAVVEICAAPERILRNLTILRARNKQLFGWLAGFALLFVCAGNVRATTTATITIGTQSGTATYGTASSSITFAITVAGSGNGGATGTYTVTGLPTGASGSFSPTTYSVANSGSASSTLTITTLATTPAVTAQSFTVTTNAGATGSLIAGTGSLTVGKKTVTPTVTLNNKTYDGTTAAVTIASRSLSGIVNSDDVNLGTSGTVAAFSSKNVGSYTPNITSLALSGNTATNYVLSSTTASASSSRPGR